MFQPRVKLEFVRRYCSPENGWRVCVDIDPSEEGRTGGTRENGESVRRQEKMREDGLWVRKKFEELGVRVGDRKRWCKANGFRYLQGDPDIVAYDAAGKRCLIAEVEGASSGQPEQKLYKAVGQMVRTVGCLPSDWHFHCSIVVHGGAIQAHLEQMHALEKLDIAGLALRETESSDRWVFGTPPFS